MNESEEGEAAAHGLLSSPSETYIHITQRIVQTSVCLLLKLYNVVCGNGLAGADRASAVRV
jgi:hypothetical protein